jgi:hypothetical protein
LRSAAKDKIEEIKNHLRKEVDLDEKLNYLTDIGLETESDQIFSFTEHCRWLLCRGHRKQEDKGQKVPRLSGKQKIKELLESEGY